MSGPHVRRALRGSVGGVRSLFHPLLGGSAHCSASAKHSRRLARARRGGEFRVHAGLAAALYRRGR
eukprot:12569524-Alexandrium_andersonii.AAC.1